MQLEIMFVRKTNLWQLDVWRLSELQEDLLVANAIQ